jgi:primosomal protein N'
VRGRYRFRLLVKRRARSISRLSAGLACGGAEAKGKLKLEVDVDPQSFL